MFDIHAGGLDLGTVFLILIPLVLLAQILLCFMVKPLIIRLLPAAILALITALLLIATLISNGWDSVGYLILTVWSAIQLAACGIGWAVWGISRLIKHIKSK